MMQRSLSSLTGRASTAPQRSAATRNSGPCAAPCNRLLLGPWNGRRILRCISGPDVVSAGAKLVLGIETSCDDTGAAVVTSDGRVLGEALATQAEIHAPWGGVVPSLAMQAHAEAIDRVVERALAQAGISAEQLDAVAVTIGPGLSLCLRVGVTKARQLSHQHQLPLINVHHMEGHALVARLPPAAVASSLDPVDCTASSSSSAASTPSLSSPASSSTQSALTAATQQQQQHAPEFPFLCLLVSGGHNLLLLVKGVGQYVQLGTTLDDALGEAYDKIARLLGLELKPNGGAALEAFALKGDPLAFKFAIPMRKYGNCDFSYAGLKTSVRLAIERTVQELSPPPAPPPSASPSRDPWALAAAASVSSASTSSSPSPAEASASAELLQAKADIAASFQYIATTHLTERVRRGIRWAKEELPEIKALVVAGGVASNKYIRSELEKVAANEGVALVLPPPKWCTDNGVMIAWAGVERMKLGLMEPPVQEFSQADQRPPAGATAAKASASVSERSSPSEAGSKPEATPGAPPTSPEAGSSSLVWDPAAASSEETWVELRPRWPLTNERHPKCMPENLRSAKKARLSISLSDMTAAELTAAELRSQLEARAAA